MESPKSQISHDIVDMREGGGGQFEDEQSVTYEEMIAAARHGNGGQQ